MKKEYLKPEAEYIVFYTEEEIADIMPPVDSYTGSGENDGATGNLSIGGSIGEGTGDPEWE